jgi:hypothetical protein
MLFDTESDKMTKLIKSRMAITNATLDMEKRDKREVSTMKKELDHLRHQAEYYQKSTQAVVLLKCEFREMYAQFTSERDLFTACIIDFQEDTLTGLATCKDMQRWYEKAHQALEWIDYINEVHKGRDTKEHGIQVLMDSSIARIRKVVEHWVSMVQEPQ